MQRQLVKMEEVRVAEVSRDTLKIVTIMITLCFASATGEHSMGRHYCLKVTSESSRLMYKCINNVYIDIFYLAVFWGSSFSHDRLPETLKYALFIYIRSQMITTVY